MGFLSLPFIFLPSKFIALLRLFSPCIQSNWKFKFLFFLLDSGSTIIIFPEGTRKKPGAKADYKTGFVGIYNNSKRKLQPVALNSGLFWQKGLKIIKRGHIIIEFLPQIDIGLDKKEVLNKLEDSIESATNKLLN